jgi:hypothetical protein
MDLHLVHCFVPDLHTWRKTRHGDGKGKSNTTEVGEDEKVDITCVKGEAARAH